MKFRLEYVVSDNMQLNKIAKHSGSPPTSSLPTERKRENTTATSPARQLVPSIDGNVTHALRVVPVGRRMSHPGQSKKSTIVAVVAIGVLPVLLCLCGRRPFVDGYVFTFRGPAALKLNHEARI